MLAQECGDKVCLDLANSWYCLINSSRIDPFEKRLPDMQDPQSLSQAIQFMVKFGALCGYLPLDLFNVLLQSDSISNKNSILEHVSDSLALRSALWCLYGRHEMTSLYAQLLLNLKKTWAFGDVGNTESISKVLASLSTWFHNQGETFYGSLILHHAKERFPRYPNAGNWMISSCLISIRQGIYRCKWQEAQKACCQLYLFDKNLANLQRAEIFVAKRYFNAAKRLLQHLLKARNLDTLTQVRVLVLLAYATMAEHQCSSETVDLLMKASVLAESHYMEYEYALIDMILSQVLLQMQMPAKALQAIKNAMIKIHINGGIYDRAKADFIFVKCLMATAKNAEMKKRYLRESLEILERAVQFFKRLEAHSKVLDIFYFVSQSFHEFGDLDQRNKYACKFRHYHMEFPIAREYLGLAF